MSDLVRCNGHELAEPVGIEISKGGFLPIFDAGTPVPAERSETFSTSEDNQTSITLYVFAGDSDVAADNRSLGRYAIVGIRPAPRGVPQTKGTFRLELQEPDAPSGYRTSAGGSARFTLLATDEGTGSTLTVEREPPAG